MEITTYNDHLKAPSSPASLSSNQEYCRGPGPSFLSNQVENPGCPRGRNGGSAVFATNRKKPAAPRKIANIARHRTSSPRSERNRKSCSRIIANRRSSVIAAVGQHGRGRRLPETVRKFYGLQATGGREPGSSVAGRAAGRGKVWHLRQVAREPGQ